MQARFCIDTGTHNATIHSLLAAGDGKSLVSASRDGVIRVWDVESGSEVRRILGKPLDGRSQWMTQIALVDQDRHVLTLTQEVTGYNTGSSRLDIFHIPTGNLVRTTTSSQLFSLMAVSDENRILALTTSQDQAVFLYNLDHLTQHGELSLLRTISAPGLPAAVSITRIHDDQYITFACSVDGQGQLIRAPLHGGGAITTSLPGMRWPDVLACSSRYTAVCERHQGSIWLLDSQMKLLQKIETDDHPTVLEFSPDGGLLAVGAKADGDNQPEPCRVYDTGSWKPAGEYGGHDSPATSLGFVGPELVASAGGASREIHFWNARTGEFQASISGKGNASRITGWHQDLLGFCRAGDGLVQPGMPPESTRYFDSQSLKLRPGSASLQTPNASSGSMPEGLGIDYLGPYAVKTDWLATAGEDQTISLWYLPDVHIQVKTGLPAPALKLFVSRDDDWIIWSRSGFYASSLNGDRFFGIHVQETDGQEGAFYPIDRFIKQLFRPAVIHAILETGNESLALEKLKMQPVDILPLLPPVVELISPQSSTVQEAADVLHFEVRPAKSAISRIWVLKDDQFFKELSGAAVATGGLFEIPVILTPGESKFKIFAESKSSKSIPAILTRTLAPPIKTPDWLDEPLSFGAPAFGVPSFGAPATGPEVQSSVTVDSLTLNFKATGGETNKNRFELTRNGEVVWKTSDGTNSGEGQQQVDVTLLPDANLIELWDATWNRQRLYTITVTPDLQESQRRTRGGASQGNEDSNRPAGESLPNLYLLSLGVSRIKNTYPEYGFNHLEFAHLDAISISEKFTGQKSILYQDVISRLLINEKATRKNILSAVKKLQVDIAKREKQKAQEGIKVTDLAVVFLAGHGVEIDNEYYFWCHDLDIRNPLGTGIGVIELGALITSLPAEVVFLIDTCRSGMIGRELINNIDPNVLAKLLISLNERAQYILTATERDTPSFEDSTYGHGYFTQGILDAFKQLPDVTVLLLADYVQERVASLSNGDQIPVAQAYGEIYRRSIYRK